MSAEYQKIPAPFKRHTEGPQRNQLIWGDWVTPELDYLADADWVWTEKVDGTNIRVGWDGHKATYGGRTDNAQIPAKLIGVLDGLFPEELFEQQFGATPATLYGEGYGAGIQKGGLVGVTSCGLLDRSGHRVIVKVKAKDFPGGES